MRDNGNQQIIDEFRANRGQVGGQFAGARLLLLTTTGVGSGAPLTVPLGYLPDGERILIIASAFGGPEDPEWFHNLQANPRVRVDLGIFSYAADATVLDGVERDQLFARAVEADPGWGDYQAKAKRPLPVVALTEVPGPPDFGTVSFGARLKLIHDAFRRELALIRKEIAEAGPGLGAQLRVNCLTVCHGLHGHHEHEDAGMLPALSEQHPELEPVLSRLRSEHETIAGLIDDLQRVISTEDADPPQVLAEVERLIEELEKHLSYEEEQLIPVLDQA